jgi:exodeoxyribonuclease V alpha subunit
MIDSPVVSELGDLFSRLDPAWDHSCASVLSDLIEANQQGHVCLPLSASGVRRRLMASPLVGTPGSYTPLILDAQQGLYFARHWFDETRVAERFLARAVAGEAPTPAEVRPWLERLFPERGDGVPDRQKFAAALALRQQLLVISGGPGTGKTTTVVRLLALLAALSPRPLVMALAAPTGKAAARLSESMRSACDQLPIDDDLKQQLPDSAQTLHRLLGLRPGTTAPRYHASHPLPLDVLVVDEASMIDLSLMALTVDALPAHARLILLGDRDQLASVDAGAVLADLCQQVSYRRSTLDWLAACGCDTEVATYQASVDSTGLVDCVALLTHSHRFSADSGIGALSREVNARQAQSAQAILQDQRYADLAWSEGVDGEVLYQKRTAYWQSVRDSAPLDAIQRAFVVFMPLVSERRQVEELNRLIEVRLERDGYKSVGQAWYPGRPVMISTNDYALDLFNGDIGFAVTQDDGLRVAFPCADGGWRTLAPGRLPAHETVYAMTVHKSQGSEFDETWLVLPRAGALLPDRALVYTAITRARLRFRVCGRLEQLGAAICNAPQRFSGLARRLHSALGAAGETS